MANLDITRNPEKVEMLLTISSVNSSINREMYVCVLKTPYKYYVSCYVSCKYVPHLKFFKNFMSIIKHCYKQYSFLSLK